MRTMIDFVDLGSSGDEIEFADYYRGSFVFIVAFTCLVG